MNIKKNIFAIVGNKSVGKTLITTIFKEFGYKEINIQTKNKLYEKGVIDNIDSKEKYDYIKYMNCNIIEVQNPYQIDEYEKKYSDFYLKPDYIIYNTQYEKEDLKIDIKKIISEK